MEDVDKTDEELPTTDNSLALVPLMNPPVVTLEDDDENQRRPPNEYFDQQLNSIISMLSNDYLNNNNTTSQRIVESSSVQDSNVYVIKNKDIQYFLTYLTEARDPDVIVNDENAVSALVEIGEIFKKEKEVISYITDAKFQQILKNLFDYFYDNFNEYVNSEEIDIVRENNDPIFTTFHLVVDVAETLVLGAKEFDSYFYMIGGIKCLLRYFGNRKMIDYFVQCNSSHDRFRNERRANYCESLASMLNILLYLKFNRVHGFKKLNVIEILTEFSNNLEFENFELVLRAHFILANLCTRKQIESLKYFDLTLIILERTVQLFAQACQKNTKYTFFEYDLYYDGRMITFEINLKNSPNSSFLVRDDVKYRTFYTIKNSLIILAMLGDFDEKFLALSLLFFFSFDEVLSEKLRESTNLLINLEQTLLQTETLDESIFILTACLRSILNKKQLMEDYESRDVKSDSSNTQRILLSYHDSNELVCMRVKLELEKRGLTQTSLIKRNKSAQMQIPAATSCTSGSCSINTTTAIIGPVPPTTSSKIKISMENVIRSVESCDIFVMCMSSLFEFSEICQFEAYYARLLNKKIIPVIIQPDYVPDYWLEDVCEEKPAIHVNLNTIKVDIIKLIDEIKRV